MNILKNFFGHLCPVLFLQVSCIASIGHGLPVAESCINVYHHLCNLPLICLCRKTLGLFCILCKACQNQGHGPYMYLHTHPRAKLEWAHCSTPLGIAASLTCPYTQFSILLVPAGLYFGLSVFRRPISCIRQEIVCKYEI